ncbi:MAG: hypothetical protein H6739_27250 [Alphaproteobacteria bacterium]|nr:hypothetical protein [Alphaproteobacteria bacterium]
MLTLALLTSALAAAPVSPELLPPLERPVLAQSFLGQPHTTLQKSGGKQGGKKGAKNKKPHWESEPYIQPGGGLRIYKSSGSTQTVATLGGQLGYQYKYVNAGLPQWRGRTRAQGEVLASGDTDAGLELRVGSFMGPHWKYIGAESGLDLLWNRWTYGDQVLAPSLGAEVPVRAVFGTKDVSGYAGVASSFFLDESRRVDWSTVDVPGFGHEFAYQGGVSGRVLGVVVGGTAEYRITAAGPVSTFMLTAQVDGTTIQDIIDRMGGVEVGNGDTGSGSGGDGSNQGGGKK